MRGLTVVGLSFAGVAAIVLGAGFRSWGSGAGDLPMEVGTLLPEIHLRPIGDMPDTGVALAGATGGPVLVNAFASWCAPCRQEHPLLVEIGEADEVTMVGINVSDLPENATAFLTELGNPYDMVGADPNKEVFSQLGLVSLPQTMVIGSDGRLLLSHSGPINRRFVDEVLPSLVSSQR